MFELSEQIAKLSDVNPRAELHGESHKLAADLKFEIKWDHDFAGYTTTFHLGATEVDNIVLGDCALDGWKFDCQDGGTVGITFRCIAHPEEGDLGRLCSMIQQNVTVTMVPPEASAEAC